jgi:cell division septation protein DedD
MSPQEKKAEGEPPKERGAKGQEAVARPAVKATPGGRFSVQVGAMAQEANAQVLSQKLEKLGYAVTIRKGRTSATQHVVLVAAPGERSEADALVERLKAEGISAVVGESDGGYRVEAGRSAVLDEAIDIARELQKKGFTPKIASETAGPTLYLVRVGQFASRGEASKRAKELREKGFPALIVKR